MRLRKVSTIYIYSVIADDRLLLWQYIPHVFSPLHTAVQLAFAAHI